MNNKLLKKQEGGRRETKSGVGKCYNFIYLNKWNFTVSIFCDSLIKITG